jgi:hypothetical protein
MLELFFLLKKEKVLDVYVYSFCRCKKEEREKNLLLRCYCEKMGGAGCKNPVTLLKNLDQVDL